ncbi:hypothetical protein E2320_008127, partial [Naja naja]
MKMRAGGMSDSSKWKKQKRSLRNSCHVTKVSQGIEQSAANGTGEVNVTDVPSPISSGNSENVSSIVSPLIDSGLELSSQIRSKDDLTDLQLVKSLEISTAMPLNEFTAREQLELQNERPQREKTPSASVESIPEVLEECTSVTDSVSIHDMDYVNPRGVRFTQCSQKEGTTLVPYGLPCIRELLRFLISLTNPHDRHNSEVMIHMGLQLLTVALELTCVANCPSLLGLIKEELCRYLFQLLNMERLNLYSASLRVCFLLFEKMREHLKFQLEMYIKKLMEIITVESPKMIYEMKEMALEAIVQLWRIPSFVTELYINYDCDYYCANLFEDLSKLLSKVLKKNFFGVFFSVPLQAQNNKPCLFYKEILGNISKDCRSSQFDYQASQSSTLLSHASYNCYKGGNSSYNLIRAFKYPRSASEYHLKLPNAFPVSGQLYTTHLLSLEALLTVTDQIEARCQAKVLRGIYQQEKEILKPNTEIANIIRGAITEELQTKPKSSTAELPETCSSSNGCLVTSHLKQQDCLNSDMENDTAEKIIPRKPTRFSCFLPRTQELIMIKNKKKLLISGSEHFNQKPKKGIQLLQEKNLLATPMDNNQVAKWLRENPKLDKKMIGEFVSDRKNVDLLDSF